MIRSYDGTSTKRVGGKNGDRSPSTGFTRLRVVYTAIGGETSVSLSSLNAQFTYTPGAAQIEVKRSSGGALIAGLDFFELTNSSVGFPSSDPLVTGEIVEVTRNVAITGIAALSARPDGYQATATVGQTLIAASFSWPYALPATGIRVYIHGIRQTRGVDFTEVNLGSANTNQVTLTSALIGGENIILEPTFQAIDQTAAATTFNSTQLSNIQSALAAGSQAFIDATSLISVPATTIVGRAKIVDIANDLRPSFGIERIMTQQIVQLQTEFGPNGETVFSAVNDDRGLIRFVGSWVNMLNSNGSTPGTINDATSYCEITFYGTGLNLLIYNDTNSRDYRVSVDGGSEGSNLYPTSVSPVLINRNTNSNVVQNAVSSVNLGVHTVKIRNNSISGGLFLFGFEVLNANSATSLNINPGVSYISGQKYQSLSAATSAYSSGFTNISGTAGTTGGRAVVYQNANGAIAKDIQYNATTPSYLTAASHTNEEIVRTYFPNEFGAGRSDDFSINQTAAGKAFTLDDGTTTLVGSNTLVGALNGRFGLYFVANNFISFTFVGTGLDVELYLGSSETATYTISVDGTSVGNLAYTAPPSGFAAKTYKLASGLPYGTHTVRITVGTTGPTQILLTKYVTYQPKTPSLPTGAVSLGAYNVMANYTLTTTTGVNGVVSPGTLRKTSSREWTYIGTWAANSVDSNFFAGQNLGTQTAGSTASYTFFGTGCDFRTYLGNSAYSFSFAIDGITNLSSYTTSFNYTGSGITYTSSTGTISGTASGAATYAGAVFSISGLPLGMHTIKYTQNNTTYIYNDVLDIITPIHSQKSNVTFDLQNTLTVGSQGIQDNRVFTPVKDLLPSGKNAVQAFGVTSSPTTTSAAFVPVPDLSTTITVKSGRLRISYGIQAQVSAVNQSVSFYVYVDGIGVGVALGYQAYTATSGGAVSNTFEAIVSPGTHKVDLYWNVGNAFTALAIGTNRSLLVEEV